MMFMDFAAGLHRGQVFLRSRSVSRSTPQLPIHSLNAATFSWLIIISSLITGSTSSCSLLLGKLLSFLSHSFAKGICGLTCKNVFDPGVSQYQPIVCPV